MLAMLCSVMRVSDSRNTQLRSKGHARRTRKYRVSIYNCEEGRRTIYTYSNVFVSVYRLNAHFVCVS